MESKESKQDNLNEVRSKQQCHFCGGSYPHSKGPCPAKGKDCRKCGKRNHFAKVCRGKQQQSLTSGVASVRSAVMLFQPSAEGARQLGGSGGMPPQKNFEF